MAKYNHECAPEPESLLKLDGQRQSVLVETYVRLPSAGTDVRQLVRDGVSCGRLSTHEQDDELAIEVRRH
ncbi:hypothetical protein [Paraburkholderia sp. BL17N1]|uniref:hypothetical protein n=1 Tax=Paraburkholderia sp. BL17N1 TaxID=1938798 RepID=UPI000F0F41D9|nr:hypothetical protein [Paraburkholderia sp. BL17N1]RKR31664.1 hypothetical protein B0G82_7884 [Paraburkholderia sp. BL17N1]